jgi:hypothetical protein
METYCAIAAILQQMKVTKDEVWIEEDTAISTAAAQLRLFHKTILKNSPPDVAY